MTRPERGPSLPDQLTASFAFDLTVRLAEALRIGASKNGERALLPILGGEFSGPELSGQILPGGADWQLTRPDGVLELDARYTIRTSDEVLIQVRNRGFVYMPPGMRDLSEIYARTVPEFEAPSASPHAWLNRTAFVGTLKLLAADCVKIRVYKVL
jgi:hypothetical protein